MLYWTRVIRSYNTYNTSTLKFKKKELLFPELLNRTSAIVLVNKNTGVLDKHGNTSIKYWMCIDYRKFSKVSKGDVFPVTNLELMFNRLQKTKCLSSVNLSMAYQISLCVKCRHFIAFVVPKERIFEWELYGKILIIEIVSIFIA